MTAALASPLFPFAIGVIALCAVLAALVEAMLRRPFQ